MEKSAKPLPSHRTDFLDWLEVEKGLSTKSQENYARFLQPFFSWLLREKLEHIKPHELSSRHVWDYRLYLARTYQSKSHVTVQLKKSTQNYYLIALRSFLNYFADKSILALPSEQIKLARDKGDKQVRFLNLEQVEQLVAIPDTSKPQGIRDRALLEILFSTGMRIAELVALNREQVKTESHTEELELGIVGKGGRARTVYFSKRALEWVSRYLETRKDSERALFVHYRGPTNSPARLSPRSIQILVKRYALLAGLPIHTTPHVMRHSFATDLLGQGVDLRVVQEFLGHKHIAATQIYTHVTSKQLREIHKKFHAADKNG